MNQVIRLSLKSGDTIDLIARFYRAETRPVDNIQQQLANKEVMAMLFKVDLSVLGIRGIRLVEVDG